MKVSYHTSNIQLKLSFPFYVNTLHLKIAPYLLRFLSFLITPNHLTVLPFFIASLSFSHFLIFSRFSFLGHLGRGDWTSKSAFRPVFFCGCDCCLAVAFVTRCEGWWSRFCFMGRFMGPSMKLTGFPAEVPGISSTRYATILLKELISWSFFDSLPSSFDSFPACRLLFL